MRRWRAMAGAAGLAAAVLLPASCGPPPPAPPATVGDALVVAVGESPWRAAEPPDPAVSRAVDRDAVMLVGLLALDGTGQPGPGLARRAVSPDGGRTWDLRLGPGPPADQARRLASLWRRQVPRHPAGAWLLADVEVGPVPVDEKTLRFRLRARGDDFPRRLAHPWLRLDPGAAVAVPQVRLVPAPAAGGLFLLRQGRVAGALLSETEMAVAGDLPGLRCAGGATAWHLLLQRDATGGVPDGGLLRRLDRARLARRVAPATGRPLSGPRLPPFGPPVRSLWPPRLPLLVDAGDPLARALADQVQADALDAGLDLRVEAEASPRYAERLRGGRYTAALVGLRPVFGERALDRQAWLHATGGDGAILDAGIPLLEVDECWAWQQPEVAPWVLRRLAAPPASLRSRARP